MDKLKVEFTYLPVVNFAMQQNRVSLIRQLSIENLTGNHFNDLKVTLIAEPVFGEAVPVAIQSLGAGETIRVESLSLNLSSTYFAQLTERLAGSITVQISSGEDELFRQVYPIDILAYDQWGGIAVLPEMLSAFVTPNHPAIVPVIRRAAAILEQWTGSPSLDEYQSRNPDRVRKQMAAIYSAIAEQDIIYSTVPASFEEYGQRVRLADTVMSQKLGTCLDMALFYASCLEAVGIYPLIIVVQGHAFAGGWLVPETFPDNVIDDASLITKRTADGINDITLVETTGMNMGVGADFDQAVRLADKRLVQLSEFILAVDIKRSRFSGIRPIPQRILNGQYWEIKEDESQASESVQSAPQAVSRYDLSGIDTEIVVTKQLMWERKLLDLSLRNNLLNIRVTKNTLQLIPADLPALEDALAEGSEFRIMHKPTDWDNPLYNFGIYQSVAQSDPIVELINSELSQSRLRSYLSEADLAKALTYLYRSSRTAMEENGANTLYLALGLLRWYETPASERPRYAPILLLPVEIVRKSASKGYIIRSREEDTMMNITLLEMLRQNFGITISGLDPLPVDEKGVNVKLIYSIIRNSIKDQRKWDVEEQAILGIFSFNKFIMWNDIHNNSHKLAKNPIVSSLMNGKIEWEVDDQMADASDLEKQLSLTELMLPISADSSQFEAIYEAVNDKSFILHGPPGTGKSQTITNIIANALYKGKRVLFVAEKMAALSVVQNRLAAIGLAPFCLELHSNKVKKTAVLSQLKDTSEVVKQTPPENFAREAERLLALRKELNVHIEALHKVYPFGWSLYDAISHHESITEEKLFDIPRTMIESLDEETLLQWREAVDSLVRTTNACGHPHNHPLSGIEIANYSSALKDEARSNIGDTVVLLEKIKSRLSVISELLGDTQPEYTKADMDIISAIMDHLLHIPELTPDLLTAPRLTETIDEYREVGVHGKERDRLKNNLGQHFTADILAMDARQALLSWNQASDKWFLPRLLGQRKIKKMLKLYAVSPVETDNVRSILNDIIKYQEEEKYVAQFAANLPSLFGRYGRRGAEDWAVMEQIMDETAVINSLIMKYANDISDSSRIKKAFARQLSEGIEPFRSIYGNPLAEINSLLSQLETAVNILVQTLGISKDMLYSNSADWIALALTRLNLWLSNWDMLKDWYQWLVARRQVEEIGLGFVASRYKEDNIPSTSIEAVFEKAVSHAAILYIISQEPQLELFKGKMFNEVIEKYKRLMADFSELTKKELFARLAANIPSFTREAAQNSEVGILQRNIRNNARGISIRKLFDQIPTLLSRMCPCMLMSPISVAQYIDADADKFDLIVFDEASQMPTYEAVGAIARGNNVVIVGDPKQMPPTNFFSVNTVDEDNIEMEDLESILDDCLALSIPSKHLLWHYRSKHESLIAFSNSEYYDNKLLTFPSPDNIESKVKMVHIEGFYDKGKSRQNKTEAQAVINEIERRLRDRKLRKKSIGVVTFSAVQQSLIEDLLSDLFIFHPELETLALECEEPLFIKNLENVQGDERDVILFSVGYGPDASGRVSMNFGPLNRLGGERRLNVAVSRARYEMIIFSTLRSEQIDLARTSAVGVVGLKRFLEYAERGERIVVAGQAEEQPAMAIENVIAGRLREEGFTVHTNIGCSGYKIDIGIVDPENPSKYILGILCDGKNYKRTKTARDREIVQNGVLKLLGWNICRIWTMDWWENSDDVISQIKEAITNKPQEELYIEELPEEEPEIEAVSQVLKSVQQQVVDSRVGGDSSEKYISAELQTIVSDNSTETFLSPESRRIILSQMKEVIQVEAPVSRLRVCRQILAAWGISRLGQRLDANFEMLFSLVPHYKTKHEGLIYIWNDKEQCDAYDSFRPGASRDAVDLPPEEIANAMRSILRDEISLPVSDLQRLCAQLFGFARSGTNVEAAMQRGLKEAERKGYIRVENLRAVIC
ncbi:DUF3320 domain-containing protein [Dysgonomonas sp. 511]|uniref:DUF3320 domain-containing protein n=1 Tax=Dysgonomonas sp. 511 TaxID=2302930 RepID=UPI0013D30EAE|nr:DUF3320 domain-containing protein [Dysgonomonas sp. 511]NDV78321.1 DUF3320 domain-containing protein [Dysgonomonas sp. 511]